MDKDKFDTMWTPEPNSGCWLWIRAIRGHRYGDARHNGKRTPAHRVSWELHKGDIPQGLQVLHRCDVPLCVNPDHLFLGTIGDNMRDMVRKGRNRNGLQIKLTPEQVLEIRNKAGTLRALGKEYGVNYRTIDDIKKRRNWKTL